MTGLTVNGVNYNVRVKYNSLKRSFNVLSGSNAGTNMLGEEIPDVIGTGYTFQMGIEPDPNERSAYDALYQVLSAPNDFVTVTVPYGQSTMTYKARVISGSDTYQGMVAGEERWSGLSVTFKYLKPQRSS